MMKKPIKRKPDSTKQTLLTSHEAQQELKIKKSKVDQFETFLEYSEQTEENLYKKIKKIKEEVNCLILNSLTSHESHQKTMKELKSIVDQFETFLKMIKNLEVDIVSLSNNTQEYSEQVEEDVLKKIGLDQIHSHFIQLFGSIENSFKLINCEFNLSQEKCKDLKNKCTNLENKCTNLKNKLKEIKGEKELSVIQNCIVSNELSHTLNNLSLNKLNNSDLEHVSDKIQKNIDKIKSYQEECKHILETNMDKKNLENIIRKITLQTYSIIKNKEKLQPKDTEEISMCEIFKEKLILEINKILFPIKTFCIGLNECKLHSLESILKEHKSKKDLYKPNYNSFHTTFGINQKYFSENNPNSSINNPQTSSSDVQSEHYVNSK